MGDITVTTTATIGRPTFEDVKKEIFRELFMKESFLDSDIAKLDPLQKNFWEGYKNALTDLMGAFGLDAEYRKTISNEKSLAALFDVRDDDDNDEEDSGGKKQP